MIHDSLEIALGFIDMTVRERKRSLETIGEVICLHCCQNLSPNLDTLKALKVARNALQAVGDPALAHLLPDAIKKINKALHDAHHEGITV